MSSITENERKWLTQLSNGDNRLPIKPFTTLRDKGLCVKLDQKAGQRGYVMADITDAGRAAL